MCASRLTKDQIEANKAAYREAYAAWQESTKNGGYTWRGLPARRELVEHLTASPLFAIKASGKVYRVVRGLDGAPLARVFKDGREHITATQQRNGKSYGPIRNIRADSTDLIA